ncbi:sodium:proton antiporter [Exilibacterium tricleocarpae]|uniref:Sodium:proton antiporter n=1 Tax=Exilibacterium tricleocarpae TaxID=2591008 RepID=A0A545STB1_9GAMM|nr:sodium:proton antiporter [Exilibacterium tricleocarpae]TQV68192.1 sodium:proton antiporter [Exilibacterium tricleocarpae]
MTIDIVVGQALFLGLMAMTGLLLQRLLKLDLTLACLLAGIGYGWLVPVIGFDTGVRAHTLKDLVFFVILPVLIFEAAWHIKPHLLKRWLIPALLLAIPGVLISCFVTAALVYWGIGHPAGFPWIAALLTGAILAATDPVAVVAKLKALKAPEDLGTLIEGESLFNDASAVVLFAVVLALATGAGAEREQSALVTFLATFFGGAVSGAVCGLIAAIVVLLLRSVAATSLVLVFTAFGSFYLAEHLLHVSGIMAVMLAAIVTRFCLREQTHTFLVGAGITWDWLGMFFNAVLFALMGLVITFEMFSSQWLAILIVIPALLVGRAVAITVASLLSRLLGKPVPGNWQITLVWGGLRGAIAIALALSLPLSLDYWWTIQSMVFGLVLFTLLVQGTTTGPLIRKLGIA